MHIPIELKEKISHISNLPTLPQNVLAIMNRLNNPKTSSGDVASVVIQDVSLSAKIIRLANSAFYGIPRTINNINEAIVILGFKVIYTIILSLTVFDMFPDSGLSIHFNRRKFLKHCIISGLLSKAIAQKIKNRKIDLEDSFCAGLLHDIGKIVMEQYLHNDMHTVVNYCLKSGESFFQSEKKLLGYTHADVTELLISRWNLPDRLYYPLVFHHSPQQALSDPAKQTVGSADITTSICHIADYLSYSDQIPDNRSDFAQPHLDSSSLKIIGFTEGDLEEIKSRLPEIVENIEGFSILFTSYDV